MPRSGASFPRRAGTNQVRARRVFLRARHAHARGCERAEHAPLLANAYSCRCSIHAHADERSRIIPSRPPAPSRERAGTQVPRLVTIATFGTVVHRNSFYVAG